MYYVRSNVTFKNRTVSFVTLQIMYIIMGGGGNEDDNNYNYNGALFTQIIINTHTVFPEGPAIILLPRL